MKTKKTKMKMTFGDRCFTTVIYCILAFVVVVTLYPLLYVLSASVSDPRAVITGKMILFPINPTLDGYLTTFKYKAIWIGYANTIFYTVVGTIMNLLITLPCAYGLSRKDLAGRGVIMTLFIITMYFGGGMIPTYLTMNSYGLVNNHWSLLFVGLVNTYNLIVARTFFANSIPWELHEAAYLDGASNFQVFRRVVLPLSSPIIVVLTLYYGIAHWNEYMSALIYLRDRNLFPLQLFLKEILTQNQLAAESMENSGISPEMMYELEKMGEVADRMKYCIIVIASAPMLIVYPRLQKFFAKGAMVGSVKG